MRRGNNKQLSQTAIAFNTALYSSIIPRTTEEALCDQKWKKAKDDEIQAL